MALSLVGAISEFHLGRVVFFDSFKSKAIFKLRLFGVVKQKKKNKRKLHTHAKTKKNDNKKRNKYYWRQVIAVIRSTKQ